MWLRFWRASNKSEDNLVWLSSSKSESEKIISKNLLVGWAEMFVTKFYQLLADIRKYVGSTQQASETCA